MPSGSGLWGYHLKKKRNAKDLKDGRSTGNSEEKISALLTAEAKLTLRQGVAFNRSRVQTHHWRLFYLTQGWGERWACLIHGRRRLPRDLAVRRLGFKFLICPQVADCKKPSHVTSLGYILMGITSSMPLNYFGIKRGISCRRAQQMAKGYGVSLP